MKLAQLVSRTGEQEVVIQVLCHLLSLDRTAVFLLKDIDDDTAKRVLEYVELYHQGTPLAYLLGYTYFHDHKFVVNKNVLVPRYDTEVVVELAEKKMLADAVLGLPRDNYRVLDLCCGSGAIGISLAYLADWLMEEYHDGRYEITAADISKNALNVAKVNARNNQVEVKFVQSDLFENIVGKFDLIVCNPPYVRTLDIGVEDPKTLQEPRIALDGGFDGLYYYRRIMATAKSHLYGTGLLIFEIGYDQAEAVQEIAENYGYSTIRVYKDLAKNDRVITMRV